MISNVFGRLMGTVQSSQGVPLVQSPVASDSHTESKDEKTETGSLRNALVREIASMIMNGRRNSTDDWIEFVYSFATRLCDDLRREAATDEDFSDRTTLQERVKKSGAASIRADPVDAQLQKLKELSLFSFEPDAEPATKEDEDHSPRAHPLAGSSVAPTFQWRSSAANSSGFFGEGAAKSRNKPAWDIPDVEFPENSVERNAVLKAIIKLLSTKRCNSTENWHRACPQLAGRLEGMLYKHRPDLASYSDLTTVTERVLQFVTLGGFKKPFQVKVVRPAEPLHTFVVPPTVLPKLNAQFSGTIPDPPSNKKIAKMENTTEKAETTEAPSSDKKRGRSRKPSSEAPEPVAAPIAAATSKSTEKPLSPAPKDLLQRQQQRLLLLQHAARCTNEEGTCRVTPHCASMKALWRHVQQCSLVKCPTPHCVSSRYVLSHWCNCADPACRMCQPAREGSDAHLARLTAEEESARCAVNQSGSSSEQAQSRKRKPTTQWEEDDSSGQMKKKAIKEQGTASAVKENVVNFGDLSSPQAKRRLNAADRAYRASSGHRGEGDGGSVHSGVSLHSHASQQSRHSATSALSRGSNHSPRGASSSSLANKAGAGSSNTAQWIQRLFLPVIEELLRVPGAELVFGQPVDPAVLGLPNYFDVVKHPMDLGTVRQTLQMRHYRDVQDLLSDVQQTFANALLYNRVGSEVYNLAKKLRAMFAEKSRKPRFELSAKLQELQSHREARVAPSLASSAAPAPSKGVAVHQDTFDAQKALSADASVAMQISEVVNEAPGEGYVHARTLSISIP